MSEMIAAIPQIAATEEPVMICLGASVIEAGFEPQHFDEAARGRGIQVRSFNLGMRNLHHQLPFIIGRIQAEFSARYRRPRLLLLSLTPGMFTFTADRVTKFHRLDREMNSQLYDKSGPNLKLFWSEPEELLGVLATHYLLGDHSSEDTFWHLKSAYMRKRGYDKSDLENASADERILLKFWSDPRLFEEPAWDMSTRGFTAKGYIGHEDWWARDSTPADRRTLVDVSVRYQNVTSDLAGLHIRPGAIDEFVALIEMAQRTADHVVILYLPEHDSLHRDRQAAARLEGLIRRMKRRSSATFLDYSKDRVFNEADFFDVVHLNRSGRQKLTQLLLRDLSPMLATGRK